MEQQPMQLANDATGLIREAAQPLSGSRDDYDMLLELIADKRVVLIGRPVMARMTPIGRRRLSAGIGAPQPLLLC
jgi:hypothetical protein